MKFVDIIDIPVFIKSYIADDKSRVIENFTHTFCKYIMDMDFIKFVDNNGEVLFISNINDNAVKDYILFCIDKSKLDYQYRCKYEDEKDIAKSLSNEVFAIKLDNEDIVKLYIKSFENNTIIFSVYK